MGRPLLVITLGLTLVGCAGNTLQQTRTWDAYAACKSTGRVPTNIQIERVAPDGRWWWRTQDGSYGAQELDACMREERAKWRPASASATSPPSTSSTSSVPVAFQPVITDVKTRFSRDLQELERNRPELPRCISGLLLSPHLYVTNLSLTAEQAGLRRGDKVTRIAGMEVSNYKEANIAAMKAPYPGSISYSVLRAGVSEEMSGQCRDGATFWTPLKDTLQAGAQGDWETCIARGREANQAVGYVSARSVWNEYQCVLGRNRSSGRGPDATELRLLYDHNRLLLSEARFTPDGIASIRGTVLTNISYLRNALYPTLASDLERLLASVEEPASASTPGVRETVKRETVRGTAFAVRPDGVLLTAFHIIQGATTIDIVCRGQRAVRAEVRQQTRSSDLAVLRIDSSTLDYLPLAPPRSAKVGDHVFTVGFPATNILGTEPKFTDGSVSSLSGLGGEATLLQTSVQIQPGSSGGPLLNERGEVIGIVTSTAAVLAFTKATGTLPQNVNWAVKADYAAPLFDPPAPPAAASTREESIQRALRAICMVEAQR